MSLPLRPFVLIRHGETDANRDGRIAGRTEAKLTEAGRAAAIALAGWDWPAIDLYVSPQRRAQETARLAFPRRGFETLTDLRERDWGHFEGLPVASLPPRRETPEGGEPWDDMIHRVARALRGGLDRSASGTLPVFVTHSGVIRATRQLLGHDPGGPSPRNTRPLLYAPRAGAWSETHLEAAPEPAA